MSWGTLTSGPWRNRLPPCFLCIAAVPLPVFKQGGNTVPTFSLYLQKKLLHTDNEGVLFKSWTNHMVCPTFPCFSLLPESGYDRRGLPKATTAGQNRAKNLVAPHDVWGHQAPLRFLYQPAKRITGILLLLPPFPRPKPGQIFHRKANLPTSGSPVQVLPSCRFWPS